jgi:hypothetical protein
MRPLLPPPAESPCSAGVRGGLLIQGTSSRREQSNLLEPRMTPRRIALAMADGLWHKSQVPIFIERFVLPVFVALVIGLAVTNPMGFDFQQRVSGALGLICFAYFLGHTIHKQKSLQPPPPPPRKTEAELPATRPQLLSSDGVRLSRRRPLGHPMRDNKGFTSKTLD